MFVIYEKDNQKVPIKVWLENIDQVEPECLQQAKNLSNLPFVFKHIALMPDTHCGYGMPIGGVIATENIIIPNAVGVDIGCGMGFVETDIHKNILQKEDYQNLVGQIMRNIPTGFDHHKEKQECKTIDEVKNCYWGDFGHHVLSDELPKGYYQIGTLGGGNHFIELQEDENEKLCIMIHSGSRNFGYRIAKYFNDIAKELNQKWFSEVKKEVDLAFLPIDIKEGQEYIKWMKLALEFAQENRQKMLDAIKSILLKKIPNIQFSNEVNAHHNYADIENHYGKNVWIHRKGAIRVREGDLGIIPGAMGSYSYIVKGKGNLESFYSCSHGAGRRMGRKKASQEFIVQNVIEDLKEQGVILGKRKKDDISEESRFAYKDIDFVINNELDLIEPIKKLKTIAVIKG
jgi:tRNA-splicing ligase RtcB